MSHVDDGELTAYADGAYRIDDPDALRISAHLSACDNCRTRLEQSQDLRTRASEVLAYATPGVVAVPEFDALEAQVGHITQRRRALPLSWAASVVLAIGLGWFGRGALQNPGAVMEDAATPKSAVAPAAVGNAQDFAATAPTVAPAPVRGQVASADHARGAGTTATTQAANADAVQTREEATMSAAPAAPPPALAEMRAESQVRASVAAPLPMITGLPVLRVGSAGAATLVEQALPDGKVVQLYISQAQDAVANKTQSKRLDAAVAAEAGAPEVVITRDGKSIVVRGDVPADSLAALARKIKE